MGGSHEGPGRASVKIGAMINAMTEAPSRPIGPLQGYHAHIYFEAATIDRAEAMRERAIYELIPQGIFVSRLVNRLVGPHPTPMFEIDFEIAQRDQVVAWLDRHRAGLSVLVHEVTGDDYRDHTEGASWLGAPVVLDFSKMDPAKPTVVMKAKK